MYQILRDDSNIHFSIPWLYRLWRWIKSFHQRKLKVVLDLQSLNQLTDAIKVFCDVCWKLRNVSWWWYSHSPWLQSVPVQHTITMATLQEVVPLLWLYSLFTLRKALPLHKQTEASHVHQQSGGTNEKSPPLKYQPKPHTPHLQTIFNSLNWSQLKMFIFWES